MKIAACVTGNNNIFYPAIVTLLSIKKYNPTFDLFLFMSYYNQHQIQFLKTKNIYYMYLSQEDYNLLNSIPLYSHYPIELYSRYIIPCKLKCDYDFVIVLDHDILCMGEYILEDILPYDTLVSWRPSVRIKNCISHEDLDKLKKNNLIIDDDLYAPNAGVIIYNEKIIDYNFFQSYIELYNLIKNFKLKHHLDEILLGLASKKLNYSPKLLDISYNLTNCYYQLDDNKIKNLHYVGLNKPWLKNKVYINRGINYLTGFLYRYYYIRFIDSLDFKDMFIEKYYNYNDIIKEVFKYEKLYRSKIIELESKLDIS